MDKMDIVTLCLKKEATVLSRECLESPAKLAYFARKYFEDYPKEAFGCFYLDIRCHPISYSVITIGNNSCSMVDPADVIKPALLCNAHGIIIVHNHLSGVLTPSSYDTMVTERINRACSIIGLDLLDHIIVGNNDEYFSFRQKELLALEEISYTTDYMDLVLSGVAEE